MGIPLPPPWVMLSLALGLSKHVQDLKDISSLGWTIMRGQGDGAGCGLCDKLVSVVLRHAELDDLSEGGGLKCESICFKVGKCVETCEKITSAMCTQKHPGSNQRSSLCLPCAFRVPSVCRSLSDSRIGTTM